MASIWALSFLILKWGLQDAAAYYYYRKVFLQYSLWIVGSMVVADAMAVFGISIYFSNKIAGPLYRIEKSLGNLSEGKATDPIQIRGNDLLHPTVEIVNRVIQVCHRPKPIRRIKAA